MIIAEHDGTTLNPSTAKCASCAAAIGHPFDIVVMGENIAEIGSEAAAIEGAATVIAIDAGHLARPLAAVQATEIAAMADRIMNGVIQNLATPTVATRTIKTTLVATGTNRIRVPKQRR
ncbi:MAG: hypothetical protein ACK2T5_05825 [Anaerolineales bacterium]